MAKSAVVAGGTGLVGRFLLERLAADPGYGDVTALVRRSFEGLPSGVREVVVDFDRLEDFTGALAADVAFCTLGTTIGKVGSREAFARVDRDYPAAFARLTRDRGADAFHLLTALGANPGSPVFYNRIKGEVEAEIAGVHFPGLVIYRPSLLLGERTERRPLERIAQRLAPLAAVFLAGPLARYRGIRAEDVARAMAAGGLQPVEGRRVVEGRDILRMARSGRLP